MKIEFDLNVTLLLIESNQNLIWKMAGQVHF